MGDPKVSRRPRSSPPAAVRRWPNSAPVLLLDHRPSEPQRCSALHGGSEFLTSSPFQAAVTRRSPRNDATTEGDVLKKSVASTTPSGFGRLSAGPCLGRGNPATVPAGPSKDTSTPPDTRETSPPTTRRRGWSVQTSRPLDSTAADPNFAALTVNARHFEGEPRHPRPSGLSQRVPNLTSRFATSPWSTRVEPLPTSMGERASSACTGNQAGQQIYGARRRRGCYSPRRARRFARHVRPVRRLHPGYVSFRPW